MDTLGTRIGDEMSAAVRFLTTSPFLRRGCDVFRRSCLHNPNSRAIVYTQVHQTLTKVLRAFLILPSIGASRAISFAWKTAIEEEPTLSKMEEAIIKSDELHNKNEFHQVYDLLLPFKDEKNAEVLWRLARATRNCAQLVEGARQNTLYYEALEYSKQALELDDQNSSCHKWYAILFDIIGGLEGTKQRIKNSYEVKEHFLKAVELNPNDATASHTLGMWHFMFADLPWYQRTIASAIFATPPSSTYEEALVYFLDAEKKDPGFYCMNVLMVGKTYARMKNKDEAIRFLKQVLDFPPLTVDDKQAHKEAVQLLGGLGVKQKS